MTREEAKRRLLNIERCIPIYKLEEARDIEALDMAIKALEQETVSKESYDHEYFLRKELETKLEQQASALDKIRAEIENHCGLALDEYFEDLERK